MVQFVPLLPAMAMPISSTLNQTSSVSAMLSTQQLFHLFNRFSVLTSLSDVKKRVSDAVRDDNQEAVAVTTAIQEEIFSEMGVDVRFGMSCLGKVSSFYENDHELMIHFYKFVATEEMACDEAELEPAEFAEKMHNQHQLHELQLEMLKRMRKLRSNDQSTVLEKLHQQLESAEFDSSASILSSEEIQEIVQRKSVCLYLVL